AGMTVFLGITEDIEYVFSCLNFVRSSQGQAAGRWNRAGRFSAIKDSVACTPDLPEDSLNARNKFYVISHNKFKKIIFGSK
ncbi:TPA: hypothetical protein ACPHXX_003460, partial [Legionella anisa]|uniref:hypothetical protein n=1 Tax=Legionella anisa TaxID=28082 RepID=UPI00197D106E